MRNNGVVSELPVIDISPLLSGSQERGAVAERIGAACRDSGFFYVSGHGVPPELVARLDATARRFFELPVEVKGEISMDRGGRAWRGFFPVGGELTSGRPDQKEGVYFGAEEPKGDRPLRGPFVDVVHNRRRSHYLGVRPKDGKIKDNVVEITRTLLIRKA